MTASKNASGHVLKSDLRQLYAHVIEPAEYEEVPELDDEALSRAVVKRGGRPVSSNPRQLVSIRLPASVLAAWKATGPGWQTRMAERLSHRIPEPASKR